MFSNLSSFKILDYIDHLAVGRKKGEYLCPGCGSDGFKIDRRSGKYNCWKGGCMEAQAGKDEVVRSVLTLAGVWVEPQDRSPHRVIPSPSKKPTPLPIEIGAIVDVRDPSLGEWVPNYTVIKELSQMRLSARSRSLEAVYLLRDAMGGTHSVLADAIRVTSRPAPTPTYIYVGLGKGVPMLQVQGSEIRSLVGDTYPIDRLVSWAAPYRYQECLEALSKGETVGWVASEAIADWFWEHGQPATTSLWQGTGSISPRLFPEDALLSGAVTLVAARDEDIEYLEQVEEALGAPCRWFFLGPDDRLDGLPK